MTATAQEVRTKECPNETQSLVMIRNVIRTAVSSICYIRGIFPEGCFSDRVLAGVNIKTLQPNTGESTLICKWLEEGVFDALAKKYLKAIIFGIYLDPERPTTLLECYNFTVSYPEEGGVSFGIESQSTKQSVSLHTKEQIKKSTVNMLRTLISMASTLGPLPDERFLTVKLLYYDDRTPSDYEPNFFRAAPEGDLGFDNKPVKIKIGGIITPYHKMELRIQTVVDSLSEVQDEEKKKEREKAAERQRARRREVMYSVDQDEEEDNDTPIASQQAPVETPVSEKQKERRETIEEAKALPATSETSAPKRKRGDEKNPPATEKNPAEPHLPGKTDIPNGRRRPLSIPKPALTENKANEDKADNDKQGGRKRVEVPLSAQSEGAMNELSEKVQRKLAKFEISDSQDTWIRKRRLSTVEEPIMQKKKKSASQKEE